MDEPASPRSKLLEQIYVRGSDTVIRISEDAVIVTTTREGGIRLPDDMIEVSQEDAVGEKETSADPEDPSTHPDDDQDPTKTIEERSTEIPSAMLGKKNPLKVEPSSISKTFHRLKLLHIAIPSEEVSC